MTSKTKPYFLAFVIMGLLLIVGTLFVLFFKDTFGTWFVELFGLYGFIAFGIHLAKWCAKDAPAQTKYAAKHEKKIEAKEREELKKNFLEVYGEAE